MKAAVLYEDGSGSVTLSMGARTKLIEVTDVWGNGKKLVSKKLNGVCRHRTGKKLYGCRIEFRLTNNGYVLQTQYVCINKQARLVGWLEDYLSDEKCSELAFR